MEEYPASRTKAENKAKQVQRVLVVMVCVHMWGEVKEAMRKPTAHQRDRESRVTGSCTESVTL